MSKPFAKLNARPLSAAAFRGQTDGGGGPPFVVIGKSTRRKEGEGYDDATILLNAAEVPAMIRLLQRIEEHVLAVE